MSKKLICAAVMAVLFAGSALAQGFGGSEQERTGKLYRKSVGFGSYYAISLDNTSFGMNYQKALGEKFRLEVGAEFSMVWGLPMDVDMAIDSVLYGSWYDFEEGPYGDAFGYGAYISFQYRYSISKDGFFNFYAGPLLSYTAVGGDYGDYRYYRSPTDQYGMPESGKSFDGGVIGAGAIIGIEWDFSNRIQTANIGAITVRYRNDYCISLDIRPVFNLVRPYYDYPILHIPIAFTGKYMF